MSLLDLIMAEPSVTKADWQALGRGELDDEMIKLVLASDYDTLEEDE